MSIATDSRLAMLRAATTDDPPAGSDSLSGQPCGDLQCPAAAEGPSSPQATVLSMPMAVAPAGIKDIRSATVPAATICLAPAGSDSLSGQTCTDTYGISAAEGQDSPQSRPEATPRIRPPAGATITPPAKQIPAPNDAAPEGHETSHGQKTRANHLPTAVAADIPGGHSAGGIQGSSAAGEQIPGRPAATIQATPMDNPLLADPVLALAADVLDEPVERVRIANENRLRQPTRSAEDKDGETRGFGLDEAHPDVARLAALVEMLKSAEHHASLNLAKVVRGHPLAPWVKATQGIGEKQGARLLAAISDPYMRPEIVREDETIEPSRPRTVSELWAYCGYHVMNGAAAKRARGQKANWSATAKMRAYLVAESCMKNRQSPYRKVYDDARDHHAEAIHEVPCIRCGPAGKPAQPGSPLSDGHKHARALRKVAKEVLKDLWRESRRLHQQASNT